MSPKYSIINYSEAKISAGIIRAARIDISERREFEGLFGYSVRAIRTGVAIPDSIYEYIESQIENLESTSDAFTHDTLIINITKTASAMATVPLLVEIQQNKNYKPGWVWYQLRNLFDAEIATLVLNK